jgi:hypothetical protein
MRGTQKGLESEIAPYYARVLNMSAVFRWNASGSRVVHVQTAPRWQEVQRGLTLFLLGTCALVVLALPGMGLAWVGLYGRLPFHLWTVGLPDDDILWLGQFVVGAGVLLGYGLALLGQWRCLKHAPQHHSAKEGLFTALLCIVAGPALLGMAHFSGGERSYALLRGEMTGFKVADFVQGVGLLQLAGVGLLLLNILLFAFFARVIGECFDRPGLSRAVEFQMVFVCVLVGGSVGMFLCVRPADFGKAVLPGLALGWGAYFLWIVVLTVWARRCIAAGLRDLEAGKEPRRRRDSKTAPRPHSGLQRFRAMMEKPGEL